ncbi:ATPase [Aureococcus anophagefferens]|nr:ATPase [Aureococcus anophagefferens]
MSVAAAVAGGVRSGGLAMLAARSGSPGTACASRLRVDVDGDDAADVSACASLRTVGAALALARSTNARAIELGPGDHRLAETAVLGAGDANLRLVGDAGARLSGGLAVPDTCWTSAGGDVWTCDLGSDAAPRARSRKRFRSLRIGDARATPARYPNERDRGAAASFLYCNQTVLLDNRTWAITLAPAASSGAALPDWLLSPHWRGARARAWPIYSWNNFEGALRRADEGALDALSDRGASFDDPWFLVDCALPAGSACDDWDGNLDQGSRLYVYGAADALDEVGEWSWDEASDVHRFVLAPDTVVVPTLSTLLEIGVGADGVEVAGVTFADCDYDSYGFQLSPDASGGRWEPGIPHDAALRVHGAHDVVVRDCVFSNLGGGGVLIAEASARAVVRDSEFRNLGQSAVFLSGNGTTQPRFATIVDNAMSGVGEVLAAAGGLVCATCSHARFERNAVERSGRWGVNFKTSDVQAAHSENNTIAENVFRDIGTATADTGAVYLVADDGDTRFNSTIRWNRMVNVMGVKSEWSGGGGILETPASSYGVYLDNSASGVTVRGNVVADVATAAYFVHEGRANHFFDNVAYNVSNARKSGGVNKARFQLFFNNSDLTPAGNWTEWLAAGKDRRSTIDAAPKFRDAAALDLCLEDDSPAFKLGFEAIPAHICAAVS